MAEGEPAENVPPVPVGRGSRLPVRWRILISGGFVGSVFGVLGATITDSEMGFPAWVDLTGVLGGFAAGVLTTAVILLIVSLGSGSRRH